MLPKNREAVMQILKIVSPRIVGQRQEGFKCNCGCISVGPSVAFEVEPGGDAYAGQETKWFLWSVKMRCLKTGNHSYCLGLSDFIPHKEVEELFKKYFPDGENDEVGHSYDLAVRGERRVRKKMPPAVCIMDDDSSTTFKFDWGSEQGVPAVLMSKKRRIDKEDAEFQAVADALLRVKPEVYRNGPDPVLPFESRRLLDYHSALRDRIADSDCIYLSNATRFISAKLNCLTNMDITFAKARRAQELCSA